MRYLQQAGLSASLKDATVRLSAFDTNRLVHVTAKMAMTCSLGLLSAGVHAQPSSPNPTEAITNIVRSVGGFLSNVVSLNGQKLKDLVAAKKFSEAADLYASEKKFFDAQPGNYEEQFQAISEALNRQHVPEFEERLKRVKGFELAGVANAENWPSVRQGLEESERLISTYSAIELLKERRFRAPVVDELKESVDKVGNGYRQNATQAFLSFDISKERSFFDVYPVTIPPEQVLPAGIDHIVRSLATARSDDIARFRKLYSKDFQSTHLSKVATLYVDRLLAEGGNTQPTLFQKIEAVRRARSLGFDIVENKDLKIAHAQLIDRSTPSTSKVTVEATPPVKSLDGEAVLVDPQAAAADYLVVIRPLAVDLKRRILGKRQENSRFQTATRTLPNPRYAEAQSQLYEAQSNYNAQRIQNASRPTYGAAAGLLQGLADGLSSAAVGKARSDLASISPTISEPVYQDYQFDVTSVEVDRTATYRVWILDRVTKTVAQHDIAAKESKTFELASNLRQQDENIWDKKNKYVEEKSIDEFESSTFSVGLNWLNEQLAKAPPAFRPMPAESAVIAEATSPIKIVAPAIERQHRPSSAPLSEDPRLASVVVIRTMKRTIGSGFYITPDTIITNYHVVEGTQMVELNRTDGTKFVGRVTKTDIGLDLALIKVTDFGRPVQFSSSPLTTGVTVEAVGHPSGLEFTVTRGIISAVRKMRNPLVRGSNEMLVIQTDAAISPGNSGGPLFVGAQVVGVNSQKLVRVGVEGIGFAVHYAEVQRFIQEP